MFGQQMDEKRAWVPNYDLFFFEVETREGVKMLHEMQPGGRQAIWWSQRRSWRAIKSAT